MALSMRIQQAIIGWGYAVYWVTASDGKKMGFADTDGNGRIEAGADTIYSAAADNQKSAEFARYAQVAEKTIARFTARLTTALPAVVKFMRRAFRYSGHERFNIREDGTWQHCVDFNGDKKTDQVHVLLPDGADLFLSGTTAYAFVPCRDGKNICGSVDQTRAGVWNYLAQFDSLFGD